MNYKELEDNLKLMKQFKKTGLCCQLIGPTGPKGATARCNKSSIYIFKW